MRRDEVTIVHAVLSSDAMRYSLIAEPNHDLPEAEAEKKFRSPP